MFCNQCGQENAAASTFCATCGAPLTAAQPPQPGVQPVAGQPYQQQPYQQQPYQQQPYHPPIVGQTSGMAIAGFVLSFFCGLLGLIFSAIAKSEIAKSEGRLTGDGLATAGIIISIVSMLLGIVIAASGN